MEHSASAWKVYRSQHVYAAFVLVVVEVAVDVVVVLESILDVAAVVAAVAVVRVQPAAGRHHTPVHVGVVQLARLAVHEPRERLVVAPDRRQRRAERRAQQAARQHRHAVDRRRPQRHRRRPTHAEVRQRRHVRRRVRHGVDAGQLGRRVVDERVQLGAAVRQLGAGRGRREAALGRPGRDRVGARGPEVARLVEVVRAAAGRVDDRAAVRVDAQQVPGRREVVVADAGRRRQRRGRETATAHVEHGERHLAVDAVRLEAEPVPAPDVDVAVGAHGCPSQAHEPAVNDVNVIQQQ